MFNVPLKEFGNSVMKQILMTDCYDLCGQIDLDGAATVVVYPYFWAGSTNPKDPKGPPAWKLDKSSASVATMNTLPISIQAKPFSGGL